MGIRKYKSKKIKKRKMWKMVSLLFGMLILMLTIISVSSVLAYLTDVDTAVNAVMVGGNRIEIVEDFQPPAKLEPGIVFKKDISVKNMGPNDCYVRIKAVFTDSDMEKYCTVDVNTHDYEYCAEDGYYYYTKVLKSEDLTPSLFTTVKLSEEMPEEEIKDFDILIYTESYQSHGFDDYKEAWDYYHRNKPA